RHTSKKTSEANHGKQRQKKREKETQAAERQGENVRPGKNGRHASRQVAMTPESQREALAVLEELWVLSPDVRLGQLLAHLGFLGECHVGRGLGDIEDDQLV